MPPHRVSPIRVLILSSRLLVRSGLAALLYGQPQIQAVGASAELPTDTTQFDLVLWDVGTISPRPLALRFLVLLSDGTRARTWLDAGAAGIVLEISPLDELLDAIRQVSRGDTYYPPPLAQQVLASPTVDLQSEERSVEPLTEREREVLQLLAQGLSNKDIAQKLYVSVRTVEGHLANVYGKLHIKSRTEAALWATRNL